MITHCFMLREYMTRPHWTTLVTCPVDDVIQFLVSYTNKVLFIFQVRRNKRNLAVKQNKATVTKVVDDATRAMLAVFISNLILGLPHSIYHILPFDYRVFSYVIMHSVFFTHLFVDPLVFVCFNQHHRRRILQALKFSLGRSPRDEVTSQVTQSSSGVESAEQGQSKALVKQELAKE